MDCLPDTASLMLATNNNTFHRAKSLVYISKPKMKPHNPTGADHISIFILECGGVPLTSVSSRIWGEGENQGTYWPAVGSSFWKFSRGFRDWEIPMMISQAALLIYTLIDNLKLGRILLFCMTLYFFLGLSPAESTSLSCSEVFLWTHKSHSVNISLLQKPSIKKSTAKKTWEWWVPTVYNASHISPLAAKIPILASTGHAQPSEGESKLKEAGEEELSLFSDYHFSSTTAGVWACLVKVGSIHKSGHIPRSHQLHLYGSGQMHGYTMDCNTAM